MKKQITTITLGILMLASAMAMYSGESMSFETNLTNPVYTVSGNTNSLEGLTIEFSNGNIIISSDPLMASDNFTLIFFNEVTREVEKIIYRGGGGGSSSTRTEYVDKNVTVFIPIYNNTIEEIEIEKIIDNTTVIETGYESWMIFLAMAVGGAFILIIVHKKKEKSAEEIMEEMGDDIKTD